jgi:hypothetical protein
MDHPTIILVASAHHELFILKPIDDAGKIAHGDEHLRANLAERQTTGITDRRKHVELGRCESQTLKVVLKLLVRMQTKSEETNPKAGAERCEKRPLDFCHGYNSIRTLDKKQLIAVIDQPVDYLPGFGWLLPRDHVWTNAARNYI